MAYKHQHCDSYFVVDDDDHREKRCRRETTKEYEEHQKKQIQLRMAQELSQLAEEEYGSDILRYMEEQEVSLFGTKALALCANML